MRFIRRPEANPRKLDTLLQGVSVKPVEPRLEDGFMVLLRTGHTEHDAPAGNPASPAPERSGGSAKCRNRTRREVVIEVTRPGAQVRRLHRRGSRFVFGPARRDFRPAGPQRRGQDHHLPHAVRSSACHQRLPSGGRREPATCAARRPGARSAICRRSSRFTATSR